MSIFFFKSRYIKLSRKNRNLLSFSFFLEYHLINIHIFVSKKYSVNLVHDGAKYLKVSYVPDFIYQPFYIASVRSTLGNYLLHLTSRWRAFLGVTSSSFHILFLPLIFNLCHCLFATKCMTSLYGNVSFILISKICTNL